MLKFGLLNSDCLWVMLRLGQIISNSHVGKVSLKKKVNAFIVERT